MPSRDPPPVCLRCNSGLLVILLLSLYTLYNRVRQGLPETR
nr:hypothetical protein [Pseudomonas sichuanensis]